jgi:hypothetical protein
MVDRDTMLRPAVQSIIAQSFHIVSTATTSAKTDARDWVELTYLVEPKGEVHETSLASRTSRPYIRPSSGRLFFSLDRRICGFSLTFSGRTKDEHRLALVLVDRLQIEKLRKEGLVELRGQSPIVLGLIPTDNLLERDRSIILSELMGQLGKLGLFWLLTFRTLAITGSL